MKTAIWGSFRQGLMSLSLHLCENYHCYDFGSDYSIRSQFTHVLSAQLLWLVQNYDLMESLYFCGMLFWINELINPSWNGHLASAIYTEGPRKYSLDQKLIS